MADAGDAVGEEVKEVQEVKEVKEKSVEEEEENSQDKIIVRSNGTVTYVGRTCLPALEIRVAR